MKKETLARIVVLVLIFGAALAAIAARVIDRAGSVEIHAAMPEKGGWLTSNIEARVGEPLHLRLISDDVVHSFAIGQSDFMPVDILPGKATDVTLTFDEPGVYTFYCTRWCGADHWRMRGTISVAGDEPAPAADPAPPLYLQLGIDLDAPHSVENIPAENPSARRGAELAASLSALIPDYLVADTYRSHSPSQAWSDLRSESSTGNLTDEQLWDLVAWVWQQNTDSTKLAEGEALYQRDCSACHGVNGTGDWVFAPSSPLSAGVPFGHDKGLGVRTMDGHSAESPTNFTDPAQMLGASSALLQGKIIRGGMGTGMPSWGLIYTEEQTWNLVDYLWTFQFQCSEE